MSEFRQNPITKQWVLISPNRAKRPEDYRTYSVMHGLPELDPNCVFCPGNEDKNPDLCRDICRIPNTPDWQLRVIENKYPAVTKVPLGAHRDFFHSRAGFGEHEVIISRKHNEPVALQSTLHLENTLQLFKQRIDLLGKDERVAYSQIFHNHGKEAGASLVHPHYQLIALPFVPPHIHGEVAGYYHYYQTHGTCIYCDIIKMEKSLKDRVVYESERYIALCPYSSRLPFETWIMPKHHSPRFEWSDDSELKHMAFILKTVLGQLYTKLGDPPLNFYIHSMPYIRGKHTQMEEKSFYHHCTIFPRIANWAGFEFGTGISINIMPPEETAKFLRDRLSNI